KEKRVPLIEIWEGKQSWIEFGFTTKQIVSIKNFQNRFGLSGYFDYLSKKNIRVVCFCDEEYSKLLLNIDDPPLVLYIKGNKIDQNKHSISVVGTRKITPYGRAVTKKIVKELVNRNFQIVSGFMYGVDIEAHQAALKSGGKTIGILGFGFDHFFPSLYKQKFLEMLKQGMTFISEYPPFTKPTHGSFPERNRIVAGMSLGTVVTEAAKESGTMITSRLAGEYGRDVFAVPGNIFSEYSEGTKSLLNQGACLVSSGEEIAEELGLLEKEESSFQIHKDIVEQLKLGKQSFDYLLNTIGKDSRSLKINLSIMELGGLIEREGKVWKIRV
ncbi:MAG: DNA-processing protein DprA, partial [Candidatus Pacebacteria bacterium]|nr:DNA-processing protein DprA [Candidatus Paceibacterota bacterium]